MIPLRDDVRPERRPLVTWALILANVLLFLVELGQGHRLEAFFMEHGLVPARVLDARTWKEFDWQVQVGPLVSHMFLHGGWLHLIGNMWFLHIFGDNVEGRLGHVRFLVFYLLCGVAAAAAQIASGPDSFVPMVGASGAVAGVLGAYLLLYPHARVFTLVPFIIFVQFVELPAFLFLGFWALLQFFRGTAELVGGATEGVAWWAHVGGFAFGAGWMLLRPDLRHRPHRHRFR